jgi:DNA-binding PadR family transcriptional regulator
VDPPRPLEPFRHRARRGDVRAAIVALLAERPMHGYEMIRELSERTHGVWRPSSGSVYPALQRLENEGVVTGQQMRGKRLFSLTELGRAQMRDRPLPRMPWQEITEAIDQVAFQLRQGIDQVGMALTQVIDVGTEIQQAEAFEILNQTRRRLYAILAEDE